MVQRREKVSITVDKMLLDRIDEYAGKHGLKRSQALSGLVKLGFVVIGADAEEDHVAELARPESLAMLKEYYGDNWI